MVKVGRELAFRTGNSLDEDLEVNAPLGNGEKFTVHWSESESRSVVSDSCDSTDCIVHGIFQARLLEWVAFPFSRGSSQLRD